CSTRLERDLAADNRKRVRWLVGGAVVIVVLLVGVLVWWPTGSAGPFTARPYTLRVLAEHELVDMEPILQRAASATGVRVRFTYDDRAAASATVVSGAADREFDAVWLSSNRDIVRQNGGESRLGTETRIMNSPIVLGLKPDAANRLGWPNKQPT